MNAFLTVVLTGAPLLIVFLLSVVMTQARNNKMLKEQLAESTPQKEKDSYKKTPVESASKGNSVDEILNDPMDTNRNGSFDL